MKKKIILKSVVLIGFVLAVSANSWAQRERVGERHQDRGGQFEKWDKPVHQKFDRGHGRGHYPKRHHQHYRPVHRFKPKFHKGRPYGGPHPKWHRSRHWRDRPNYRRGHPRWHHWRHHHRPVIHNYYGSTESYAAEDEFHASATVSDSGFSVSVGVSKTN
jgi:hypothetical protein